jgi:hypothetical protein
MHFSVFGLYTSRDLSTKPYSLIRNKQDAQRGYNSDSRQLMKAKHPNTNVCFGTSGSISRDGC